MSGIVLLMNRDKMSDVAISGAYFQAIQIAYGDWKKNVSRGRYKLSDQDIAVVKAPSGYLEVTFTPDPYKGTVKAHLFGDDVVYVVDVRSQKVVCRGFGDFV